MSTHDRAAAVTRDDLVALLADVLRGDGTTGSGIGLELELFPVSHARPTARLRLDEEVAGAPPTRTLLAAAAPDAAVIGATLTAEPGGQVEIATGCCQRVPDAIDQLDRASARLAARFDDAGAALVAAGVDVWHDVADVPQQLDAPRYRTMDAHLAHRGDDGRLMMRHTCALQVNVDLGTGADREDRWLAANLLSPIATATFASSPGEVDGARVRSRRSLAWQRLDPTRTGYPRGLLAGAGTVEDHVLELALRADVLRVPGAAEDDAGRASAADHLGRPGWSFADWMTDGHPAAGWPTLGDARDHLTTLFPEVRARGFLELRAIDAVPARYRAALVLLVAGALLDPVARGAVLGVLEPHRATLPALTRRCATDGLTDPRLCAVAVAVWSYARDGASRLPGVERHHLAAVEAYVDRFTVRGRSPADDLADLLTIDRDAALDWATEPLPTTSEVHR